MSRFEVRELDSLGALITTVEADNAFRAVEMAFPGKEFSRETGWGGASGTWKIKGRKAHVWIGLAAPKPAVGLASKPKPAKAKANPTPKAKAKRK
jgi:hypothetical protein